MPGYADIKKLIEDTLVGRPAGTMIYPEGHQAMAMSLLDYIHSVELLGSSAIQGIATPDTVPVQPDNAKICYLATVPAGQTYVFTNFRDENGNSISVTSGSNTVSLLTLLWNGVYWTAQVIPIQLMLNITAGYLYAGIATPVIDPGVPDTPVFYIAGAGDYPNFNNASVPNGSIGIFRYNSEWTVDTISVSTESIKGSVSDGIGGTYSNSYLIPYVKDNTGAYGDGRVMSDDRFDSLFLPISGKEIIVEGLGSINFLEIHTYKGIPGESTYLELIRVDVSNGKTDKILLEGDVAYIAFWVRSNYAGYTYNVKNSFYINYFEEKGISIKIQEMEIVSKTLHNSDIEIPTSGAVFKGDNLLRHGDLPVDFSILQGSWDQNTGQLTNVADERRKATTAISSMGVKYFDVIGLSGAYTAVAKTADGAVIPIIPISVENGFRYRVPYAVSQICFNLTVSGDDVSGVEIIQYDTSIESVHDQATIFSDGGVQVSFVNGSFNSTTGALTGEITDTRRRASSLIEITGSIKILRSRIPSGSTMGLIWDSELAYLGTIDSILEENGYHVYVAPNNAAYIAWNLTTSGEDVSDLQVIVKREQDAKDVLIRRADAANVEIRRLANQVGVDNSSVVYLSHFMNSQQTDDQNIYDALSFAVEVSQKRVVVFDIPRLTISKAILIPNKTTIILNNCIIQQSDNTFDNVFRSGNVALNDSDYSEMPDDIPVFEDIRIIGIGDSYIVGPNVNRRVGGQEMVGDAFGIRTVQIAFARVKGGAISGITLTQTRCWAIDFELCEDFEISNIRVFSSVKNGDGIDIRVGCKNFYVHNILGMTEDDVIACTNLPPLDYSGSDYEINMTWKLWPQLAAVDPSSLFIENVNIEDVVWGGAITQSLGHCIICLSAYGAKIQNITIVNVREISSSVGKTEAMIFLYHGYGSGYVNGDINTIRISNVKAVVSPVVLKVSNCIVQNVWANKLQPKVGGTALEQTPGNDVKLTNSL